MKENAEILAATKKSFKVLSNESTGTINIQSLISSLTDDAGEPLSSNEVDFFIQSIPSEAFGKRGEGELKLSELENFLFQTDLESQKTILQSKSKSWKWKEVNSMKFEMIVNEEKELESAEPFDS